MALAQRLIRFFAKERENVFGVLGLGSRSVTPLMKKPVRMCPRKDKKGEEEDEKRKSAPAVVVVPVQPRQVVVSGEYEAMNVADPKRVRLRDVLQTHHFGELVVFAKSSFNEDCVLFYVLADAFEKCDEKGRAAVAKHLMECYVRLGAAREINVGEKMRKEVEERYDRGDMASDLFYQAKLEVELLMSANLESFLDKKRGFWKKNVAWGVRESKEKTPVADNTAEVAKFLSGGDEAIEQRIKAGSVESVTDVIGVIIAK